MINKKWSNLKSFPDAFWTMLAVIVTIIVFVPSINYSFLPEWDDYHYVFNGNFEISWDNLRYWLTGTIQNLYTPVTSYSFMIDYNLFGHTPTGYHIINLLLHCGSILFLIAIMKKLRVSPLIAAAAALLWAVNPQRIPSVVWIAERKDVLVVFFALASLYAYIAASQKQRYSVAAPLFLLLSLGAKPAAVGLPVIMLIYSLWQHRKYKWREIKLVIPVFITLILYLCWFLYIHSLQKTQNEYLPQKTWIIIHNTMWYLCSSFIPFQLNPIYPRVAPFSAEYLPLICGFLLLAGLFCVLAFKTELSLKLKLCLFISFALCWGALFLPVSGITTIGTVDYCDRYNYLPSIVLWIMLAMFISWQSHKKWMRQKNLQKVLPLTSLFILVIYWYSSWNYMPTWSSGASLFIKAVEWQYPNPKAINNLGVVGINESNPQLLELASGKFLFIATNESGLHYYPEQINKRLCLHSGLFLGAYSLFMQKKYNEAFPVLVSLRKTGQKGSLKFYKGNGYMEKFWGALAGCYMHYKKTEETLQCLSNQLHLLESDSFDAFFNKGLTAFLKKDFATAEKYWKEAGKIRPDDENIMHNIEAAQKRQTEKKTFKPMTER